MENLQGGGEGDLIPGKSTSWSLFWNLHQEASLNVWKNCRLLIGPGPAGPLTAQMRLRSCILYRSHLEEMLTHGKRKTANHESQPPQMPSSNESMPVLKTQTTTKASGVSWAVYLHIQMCLLIKIFLGNFTSWRLGQIFQLLITDIRKASADLAIRQHRKAFLFVFSPL